MRNINFQARLYHEKQLYKINITILFPILLWIMINQLTINVDHLYCSIS
jgi:hypothetical protein